MCKHLVGSLFGLNIFFLCSNSYAQSVLPEVAVEDSTAHRRTFLSAASPLQQFSSADMQALGIKSVAEALRLANGVTVKDYGGLGGMKTVSVRNLGAEHTGVLYDGVPVSNCQAGQIDISRFSTDNIDAIRMGIGAPTEMLTPASAEPFSGNLYLSTPNDVKTSDLKLSYGNWNTINTSARFSRGIINSFINYSHTDGDYPFTLTNGTLKTRERRNNGRTDAVNGEVNVRHTFASESNHPSHLSAKVYYYYSDRQLPGGIVYYNNEAHERLWDENCFAQAKYDAELGSQWNVQVLAKYNHSWNKYFDGNQIDDSGITMHTYRYRQDETFLSMGVNYRAARTNDRLQMAVVVDELWNTLRNNIPEVGHKYRTTTYSTFRIRYHEHWITANASLSYTFLNESRNQKRFTPSVSMSVKPWGEQQLYFRASWRQAFRLPSFNDLYYYRLGNRDLRPERTNETNIGVTYSGKWLGGQISVTADAYHNRVKDLIVAFPTTFAWKMYNYGKVDIRGLNVMAEYSQKSVMVNVGYNLNDARNITTSSNSRYSRQVPYTARHSGNASVIWQNRIVNVGYALQWMGKRYSSLMHEKQYRLPSFDDHNLTLTKILMVGKRQYEVSLMCKNLLDRQYEIIQFYPMPGRSFFVSVKMIQFGEKKK